MFECSATGSENAKAQQRSKSNLVFVVPVLRRVRRQSTIYTVSTHLESFSQVRTDTIHTINCFRESEQGGTLHPTHHADEPLLSVSFFLSGWDGT
jgi:hypothetical protein